MVDRKCHLTSFFISHQNLTVENPARLLFSRLNAFAIALLSWIQIATAMWANIVICHLAYIERGYEAVGGEYLLILAVYWGAWKAINCLFDSLEELENERNRRKKRSRRTARM